MQLQDSVNVSFRWCLGLVLASLLVSFREDEHDWKRDRIHLKGGKVLTGVVLQHKKDSVVLLRDGNNRDEYPLEDIEKVDKLRDRQALWFAQRKPGMSAADQWKLVMEAKEAGLPRLARVQAYAVLLADPEHAEAHAFLGHEKSGSGWKWLLGREKLKEAKFHEKSRQWNSRIVLESEHFTIETDAGIHRAVEVLFDLEGQYLWWMQHVGPLVEATEDVDDPQNERATFLVHKNLDSFKPLSQKEPYYDPSGMDKTTKGGTNLARTFFEVGQDRPKDLFALGAESLIYTTLVLGKVKGNIPDPELSRSAHWVETGLAYWVSRHCGGKPGLPEFKAPLDGTFTLDFDTAIRTTANMMRPHHLLDASYELTNLINLSYDNFVGNSGNIPLCKARCGSFVSYLIEEDPPVYKGKKPKGEVVGRGAAGLWYYFREVYGTPTAASSSAFDKGFGNGSQRGKLESLEEGWKDWAKSQATVLTPAPTQPAK